LCNFRAIHPFQPIPAITQRADDKPRRNSPSLAELLVRTQQTVVAGGFAFLMFEVGRKGFRTLPRQARPKGSLKFAG
jgi:hypothetical protein